MPLDACGVPGEVCEEGVEDEEGEEGEHMEVAGDVGEGEEGDSLAWRGTFHIMFLAIICGWLYT